MRRFPAATRLATPWRNGGGETTEVAIFPESAGLDDFDWRVSVARIDSDGPFSSFPGIDRTLVLLSGGPVVLTAPDWEQALSEGSPPIVFDGADAVVARISAQSTDLNVMSRRDRCHHVLHLLKLPQTLTGEMLAIAVDNGITCGDLALDPMDAVHLARDESAQIRGPADAHIWAIAIR
ncbi:MAG: HutD family protein [Sphingomonas sp.]